MKLMRTRSTVYLDSNSGAPLDPLALTALRTYLDSPQDFSLSKFLSDDSLRNSNAHHSGSDAATIFGNHGSVHQFGQSAKRLIIEASDLIAKSIRAESKSHRLGDHIHFCSSGSRANFFAVQDALLFAREMNKRFFWITSAAEHSSNLDIIPYLQAMGIQTQILSVDKNGFPNFNEIKSIPNDVYCLMSLIWANNETGAILPLEKLPKNHRFALHLDGVQNWGKTDIDVANIPVDYLTIAPYKAGSISGLGVLYSKRRISKFIPKSGTNNMLGIVAAGAVAYGIDPSTYESKLLPLRILLEEKLLKIEGLEINCYGVDRIANTVNASFVQIGRDGLIPALDLEGFAVSAGSACMSGVTRSSHVLTAIGRTPEEAMASIRISLHSKSKKEDIIGFSRTLAKVVANFTNGKRGDNWRV